MKLRHEPLEISIYYKILKFDSLSSKDDCDSEQCLLGLYDHKFWAKVLESQGNGIKIDETPIRSSNLTVSLHWQHISITTI